MILTQLHSVKLLFLLGKDSGLNIVYTFVTVILVFR